MTGRSTFEQALELHRTLGMEVRTSPGPIPPEEVALRARLIAEEFFETLELMVPAFGKTWAELELDVREIIKDWAESANANGDAANVDLRKVARELADLACVTAGTALHYGIHLDAAAEEIHAANMRKTNDPADGKLVKGPGYEDPNMDRALARSRVAWLRLLEEETLIARVEHHLEAAVDETLEEIRPTGRRCASVTFAQEDPGGTVLERLEGETDESWRARRAALRAGEEIPPPDAA